MHPIHWVHLSPQKLPLAQTPVTFTYTLGPPSQAPSDDITFLLPLMMVPFTSSAWPSLPFSPPTMNQAKDSRFTTWVSPDFKPLTYCHSPVEATTVSYPERGLPKWPLFSRCSQAFRTNFWLLPGAYRPPQPVSHNPPPYLGPITLVWASQRPLCCLELSSSYSSPLANFHKSFRS